MRYMLGRYHARLGRRAIEFIKVVHNNAFVGEREPAASAASNPAHREN